MEFENLKSGEEYRYLYEGRHITKGVYVAKEPVSSESSAIEAGLNEVLMEHPFGMMDPIRRRDVFANDKEFETYLRKEIREKMRELSQLVGPANI